MKNNGYPNDLPYRGPNSDCTVFDKDHHPTKLIDVFGRHIADWDKEKGKWKYLAAVPNK